ncbi:MAG: hypothetical protein IPG50_26735 [Myxococcales bacterium]|nr:hypothetical protein [Myxococcales bacterium]
MTALLAAEARSLDVGLADLFRRERSGAVGKITAASSGVTGGRPVASASVPGVTVPPSLSSDAPASWSAVVGESLEPALSSDEQAQSPAPMA